MSSARGESSPGAVRCIRVTRAVLAISLLVSLVLIAQPLSQLVYAIGILLLILTVLLEFTFNNIPETCGFKGIAKGLVITWVLTLGVVLVSVALAPVLTMLGR